MAYLDLYKNKARVPGFIVVGAAKAGTTSLASYLASHPDINIPLKESFYFNSVQFEKNHLPYPLQRPLDEIIFEESDYDQQYGLCQERIIGEIGTAYLYHYQESIPRIKQKLGKGAKIFIMLRNPVDRAYSAYMHFRKDCFENLSFEKSLEMEQFRQKQAWDFMWHYKAVGCYYEQVKAYLEAFNNVSVLFFEDMVKDTPTFMKSIFTELNVEAGKEKYDRVLNPSGYARFPFLQKFITHENYGKKLFRPLFRKFFNKDTRARMRKYVKAKNTRPYDKMDPATYQALIEFYREDIEKLSILLNKDLSNWLNPIKMELAK